MSSIVERQLLPTINVFHDVQGGPMISYQRSINKECSEDVFTLEKGSSLIFSPTHVAAMTLLVGTLLLSGIFERM